MFGERVAKFYFGILSLLVIFAHQICSNEVSRRVRDIQTATDTVPTSHFALIGWPQPVGAIHWGCAGSLISMDLVLTAGRCIALKKPEVVRCGLGGARSLTSVARGTSSVATGDDDVEQAVMYQDFEILWAKQHPKYKVELYYNDIAVVKLKGKVTTPSASPACLWNLDLEPFIGLHSVGYHISHVNQMTSFSPAVVNYDSVDHNDCFNTYAYAMGTLLKMPSGLSRGQICVAPMDGSDLCHSTAGKPLQVTLTAINQTIVVPFIVGVSSFLNYACGASFPHVYTRVSIYLPWLRNVTQLSFDPLECAEKIYKEKEVQKKQDPAQTSLNSVQIKNRPLTIVSELNQANSTSCGGAILRGGKFLLTLARCLRKVRSPWVARVGERVLPLSLEWDQTVDNGFALLEIVSTKTPHKLKDLADEVTFDIWSVAPATFESFLERSSGKKRLFKVHGRDCTDKFVVEQPVHEYADVEKCLLFNKFNFNAKNYNDREEYLRCLTGTWTIPGQCTVRAGDPVAYNGNLFGMVTTAGQCTPSVVRILNQSDVNWIKKITG